MCVCVDFVSLTRDSSAAMERPQLRSWNATATARYATPPTACAATQFQGY